MVKTTDFSRTIIALATALGGGSIAVIRISGPESIKLVNAIFRGKDLTKVSANTIHFGKIQSENYSFDQVLVSVFKSPHSYTGEDYVEISCHANPFIVDDIMDLLIYHGAHTAEPGEFTLRAFLNGKLDLSQAEAVAGIIRAKSRKGVKNSYDQLDGTLNVTMISAKKELIELIGLMEIDLDFAEDDIEVVPREQIFARLYKLEKDLHRLESSYNYAKLLDGGIHLTLIGEPNAGKSTMLNQLLGENRAITSHIPGTTRDTIQENIVINDILFNLVDTAGLRESHDELEKEGVKRTKKQVSESDMVLLLIDAGQDLSGTSWHLIKDTVEWIQVPVILVANKSDTGLQPNTIAKIHTLHKPIVKMSAKTGEGLSDLKKTIMETVTQDYDKFKDDVIITSKRQHEVIRRTVDHINKARQSLNNQGGYEFVVVDMRQALNAIGELTGETVNDDILNNIFANFCIGK